MTESGQQRRLCSLMPDVLDLLGVVQESNRLLRVVRAMQKSPPLRRGTRAAAGKQAPRFENVPSADGGSPPDPGMIGAISKAGTCVNCQQEQCQQSGQQFELQDMQGTLQAPVPLICSFSQSSTMHMFAKATDMIGFCTVQKSCPGDHSQQALCFAGRL